MEQQQTNSQDDPGRDMSAMMGHNGVAPFDQHQNFMGDQFGADALMGMMGGQGFMADPSMGGMAMDTSMLMPFMMANGNAALQMPANGISSDEIALYDRQIRLWGMAAQNKIRNADVLLITIKALANEVAKNLVLAGVGTLTILDDAVVTESDLGSQFFLSEANVGQNRAQAASVAIQKLNPRVGVHVDPEGLKSKGPSYFAAYDVVIATDLDPDSYNLINTATRLNGRAFYAAGTHGMYGFIFNDLIEHDYVIERELGNVATQPRQETRTRSVVDVKTKKEGPKTIESVTKRELYSTWFLASDPASLPPEYTQSKRRLKSVSPALSCLRALWEFMQLQGGRIPSNREGLKLFTQIATKKHKALGLPSETLRPEFLRSFLQNLGSEIAPVAAILGGQLAQDVINVLGQTQQPIQNTVIFDGNTMESLVYPLHPEGTLGASLLSMAGADGHANGGAMMLGPDMSAMGMGMSMGMPPPEALPMTDMSSNMAAMGAMRTDMASGAASNGTSAAPTEAVPSTTGAASAKTAAASAQDDPPQAPEQSSSAANDGEQGDVAEAPSAPDGQQAAKDAAEEVAQEKETNDS